MKRIAFIGTISQEHRSTNLVNLYNESRVYNNEHHIKGVFLVCKNVVMQVMEGEPGELAQALYRAKRENHIENLSVIVNSNITKGLFHNWLIRFVKQKVYPAESFIPKLNKVLESQLKFNSSTDKTLFEQIFIPQDRIVAFPKKSEERTAASGGDGSSSKNYDGLALSVSNWPKPTQMKITPEVIKTCALLSKNHVSYSALLSRNIWSSSAQLNEFLEKLEVLGLLNTKEAVTEQSLGTQQPAANDRFSQLLKKFIHSPKRQVN